MMRGALLSLGLRTDEQTLKSRIHKVAEGSRESFSPDGNCSAGAIGDGNSGDEAYISMEAKSKMIEVALPTFPPFRCGASRDPPCTRHRHDRVENTVGIAIPAGDEQMIIIIGVAIERNTEVDEGRLPTLV